MLVKLVSKYLSTIGGHLPLIVIAAMFLAGTYHMDDLQSERLLEEFGSKAPSDSTGGYTPQEFKEIVVDKWGEKGCTFYLNVAVYKFLNFFALSTLLSSVLWRMLSKRDWDTSSYAAQLLFALMLSSSIEIAVECLACSKSLDEPFPLALIAVADLCHKVKMLSLFIATFGIIVLVIIQTYLWPVFMMNGKGVKIDSWDNFNKKREKSTKIKSAKKKN